MDLIASVFCTIYGKTFGNCQSWSEHEVLKNFGTLHAAYKVGEETLVDDIADYAPYLYNEEVFFYGQKQKDIYSAF